jgi:O-antigen/teichoic acid export membrane protein
MDTFGCGLVALQRYDLLNVTLITVAAAQAVAWTAVLLSGGGLLLLGIVTVGISLMGQGARYMLLRRMLPTLTISVSLVDRKLMRSLATPAGWFALGDSILGFRDYASVFVLGLVRNVATAGIFGVGEKLATLGTKLGSPIADPFFPHAAALVGRGDGDELGRAAHTGSRLTTAVTLPCCVAVAVLARPALHAWVGPTYARATPAVVILALAFGLRSVGAAPSKIVSGSGGQRLVALSGLAEVATQVAMTALLGAYFGITGVAWAVLISVVVVELGITLPLLSRRLRTGVVRLVAPILRAHLFPLAISGALGWLLSEGPVTSFVYSHGRLAGVGVVILAGGTVVLAYAGLFFVTGLDHDARGRVLAWLRKPKPAKRPGGRIVEDLPHGIGSTGPPVEVDDMADRGR